jgi:hypothetical protein
VTPSPPRYSSPIAPIGTGCWSASRTWQVVLAIGRPIAIEVGAGAIRCAVDHTRGLGRTVQVPQRVDPGRELGGQATIEGLAAAQRAEPRAAGPARGQQEPPGRRRGLHDGARAVGQERAQGGAVDRGVARHQHDLGADGQRDQELEDRDVEGQRRHRGEAIALGEPGLAGHRVEEVHDRAVRDAYALGRAGRARGVDDVRGGLGVGRRHRWRRRGRQAVDLEDPGPGRPRPWRGRRRWR